MQYLEIYKRIKCSTSNDVFKYLIANLKESNTYWDYFVNWTKVFGNVKEIELSLNILNYLIGKEDFEKEFRFLLKKHPAIQAVFPILLASRERNFKILTQYTGDGLQYTQFSFPASDQINDEHIENVLLFVKKTGLAALFKDEKIKNVVDYVTGVEAGLDSNGRKNRGGSTMEDIVEVFIKKICLDNKFDYIRGATSSSIKSRFGINVPIDKSSRQYDFAIYNNRRIYLIETNFYGGGGSKLKATAGEYRSLYDFLKTNGHPLIWITDGAGWLATKLSLEETFNHIEHLLNLSMLENGILSEIIKENL